MKKFAFILSTALMLGMVSCAEDAAKTEGGEQLEEPVMNSGPNTEGRRATEAVADSTNASGDSAAVERNTDAMSTPH